MIERINALRAARGLSQLAVNDALRVAADRHVVDLASGRINLDDSHIGSDGSTAWGRAVDAGYRGQFVREMTGWGWGGDYGQQMAYWLASPVHRPIIFDPAANEIGEAYLPAPGTRWGHYWVVVVGRGNGVVAPPVPPAPAPYVVHVPVVAGGREVPGVDLLDYLRGDGRSYRVGNAWGSFEIFQSQTEGDRFYQVKAWDDLSVVNWEGFQVDTEFIRRDVDTSPGGGRFYRQFHAPWVRRYMRPGERFSQAKRLQFYRLDDCGEIAQHSGHVTDTIEMVARHERYTFRATDWPPVTLSDVVQLRWVEGREMYFYARGYGLVGWEREHQDPHSPAWSAISEMRPDVPPLQRLRVDCPG